MAAAISFPVRSPEWVLTYQGTNITADIAPMVLSITYTDYLSELSGEVELAVEDHDRRWQAAWFPSLGDQLNVAIGYRGEGLLPCGDFQVDQLELAGPPDTFTMRCLAAFVTPAMRTRNSVGFENQTLLGIAQTIGEKYGLAVISTSDVTDIEFDRVTQKHETDLGFLKRLAVEHDYDFTVRGSLLVFYSRASLAAVVPIRTVDRTNLKSFEFRNRSRRIYRGAQVTYQNPTTKSLIFQSAASSVPVATADVLKVISRCENGPQALLKAQAALDAHNMWIVEASLLLPGSIAMASGVTFELTGFGEFDGTYIVLAARHRLDRVHGYTTKLEVIRVF